MKLVHAFTTQEAMIKQALYDEFGASKKVMDRIDAAVQRGLEEWRPHTIAIFGQDANKLFNRLDRELEQARKEQNQRPVGKRGQAHKTHDR